MIVLEKKNKDGSWPKEIAVVSLHWFLSIIITIPCHGCTELLHVYSIVRVTFYYNYSQRVYPGSKHPARSSDTFTIMSSGSHPIQKGLN